MSPAVHISKFLVAIVSLLVKQPPHTGHLLCEAFPIPPDPANCFFTPVPTPP